MMDKCILFLTRHISSLFISHTCIVLLIMDMVALQVQSVTLAAQNIFFQQQTTFEQVYSHLTRYYTYVQLYIGHMLLFLPMGVSISSTVAVWICNSYYYYYYYYLGLYFSFLQRSEDIAGLKINPKPIRDGMKQALVARCSSSRYIYGVILYYYFSTWRGENHRQRLKTWCMYVVLVYLLLKVMHGCLKIYSQCIMQYRVKYSIEAAAIWLILKVQYFNSV